MQRGPRGRMERELVFLACQVKCDDGQTQIDANSRFQNCTEVNSFFGILSPSLSRIPLHCTQFVLRHRRVLRHSKTKNRQERNPGGVGQSLCFMRLWGVLRWSQLNNLRKERMNQGWGCSKTKAEEGGSKLGQTSGNKCTST